MIYLKYIHFSFFIYLWGWSGTKPTITAALLAYCTSPGDDNDCGAISGMNEWQGETEVLGDYLPECCFVIRTSHLTSPKIELGPPR
jgi:hypothetical protein